MGVFGPDVDALEKMLVHVVVIALVALPRKALVLVEVDRLDGREVDIALVVPVGQLGVDTLGRRAGGQPEHAVGLHDHLRGDDVGGLAAHVVVVLRNVYSHGRFPLFAAALSAGRLVSL